MRKLVSSAFGLCVACAACGGGSGGPGDLAYGLPAVTDVRYTVGDTVGVEINALGQSLELNVLSLGTFAVEFGRAGDDLAITMRVEELAAELNAPLGGPIQVDESDVTGDLVFTLDRRGVATVLSTPEVANAGGLFSATGIANNFFPRLPGRAVVAGDSWSDTITFTESGDGVEGMQTITLDYTAVGETQVAGRSLLEIGFEGGSVTDQTMSLQGAEIHLMTESLVEGRVLWDQPRGLMFESHVVTSGTGTIEAAGIPGRLPTRVEFRSGARLRE